MKKRHKLRYIELSFSDFCKSYPDVVSSLNPFFVLELLSDPEYIVRFSPDTGRFEFGFSSDNWITFK